MHLRLSHLDGGPVDSFGHDSLWLKHVLLTVLLLVIIYICWRPELVDDGVITVIIHVDGVEVIRLVGVEILVCQFY